MVSRSSNSVCTPSLVSDASLLLSLLYKSANSPLTMQRTAETFQHHLDHRVAACGTFYLVLKQDTVLGPEYLIVPNACRSNYCPVCRRSNLVRLRHALIRAMAFHRWRLVTLTFAHRDITITEQLQALKRTFDLFSKRLRRRWPGVAYVRTIEVHRSGYPHVHMVIDTYIPVSWLQLHWKECGGGMVDIREGKRCDVCHAKPPCPHYKRSRKLNHHDAAGYLTEEIEKHQQDPHRLGLEFWCAALRSINLSRSLKLRSDDTPWRYYQRAMSWDNIEELCESATWSARMNDRPQPTIATRHRVAFLGPGYHGKPLSSPPTLV